jgi:hypothetical protein
VLTIASGVAQHVRLNGELLRSRLVRHSERKTIAVSVLSMPSAGEQWQILVHGFRSAIADDVGAGLARLLTCDFSTTGDSERVASEIVLMDTLATYYDYLITIVCGIPSITLTGTPTDWRSIRERIDVIAELDLGFWTTSLASELKPTTKRRPALFEEISTESPAQIPVLGRVSSRS